MPIYIGNTKLTNLKIGSTNIDKVYVGSTLVYPDETIIPTKVLISTGADIVYEYDYNTGSTTTLLDLSSDNIYEIAALYPSNITNVDAVLWVTNAFGGIAEYYIYGFPTITSYSYNRTISSTYTLYSGICAAGDGLGFVVAYERNVPTNSDKIGSFDIATSTSSYLFTLPMNRYCTSIAYNAGTFPRTVIVGNHNNTTNVRYVSEYDLSGTLIKEFSLPADPNYGGVYVHGTDTDTLYAIISSGEVYEITSSGLVYVRTLGINPVGITEFTMLKNGLP